MLGVNIDHVATVRQARREGTPDIVEAALAAVAGGADGITVHLREDRRHIQDTDVMSLKAALSVPLNLEMAAADEILAVAERTRPAWACLVPEKRQELTTEGGLDVAGAGPRIEAAIRRLHAVGAQVSLFIEPNPAAVRTARHLGADAIEFHTGGYARDHKAGDFDAIRRQLDRILEAAEQASRAGLIVNAGHGLSYENVGELTKLFPFHEFNIGFSIVGRALFVGLKAAVAEMKTQIGKNLCVASSGT